MSDTKIYHDEAVALVAVLGAMTDHTAYEIGLTQRQKDCLDKLYEALKEAIE